MIGFNHCSAMDHVEAQLVSTGRAPNIVFRSDNNGTVQGLVGAGVGVAVSPRLTVDEDDPSIEVIDLHGRVPAPRDRARLALGPASQRGGRGIRRLRNRCLPRALGRVGGCLAASRSGRTLPVLRGSSGSGPMPATTVSCERSCSRSRPRLTAVRNLSRFSSSVDRIESAQSSISRRVSRALRLASSTMSSACFSASLTISVCEASRIACSRASWMIRSHSRFASASISCRSLTIQRACLISSGIVARI